MFVGYLDEYGLFARPRVAGHYTENTARRDSNQNDRDAA